MKIEEARRAVGARPFVFGLLNIEHDLREQLDIADMVGMGMRDRHRLDVGGLDAELVELAGERFRPFHVERTIGAGRALRRRGKRVGKAGIPEEPALRVMDQVATSNLISRDSPARRLVRCTACPAPVSTLLRLVPLQNIARHLAQNASQQIRLTNSVAIVDAQCPELDIPALNGLPNRPAICA